MATDRRHHRYLGDGVYASFDGWHVWLSTERADRGWPRESGKHEIALDQSVMTALKKYHDDVWREELK